MPNCHEMKRGQIYICMKCGIEIKVIKECRNYGKKAEECDCHPDSSPCTFVCCGRDLVIKRQGEIKIIEKVRRARLLTFFMGLYFDTFEIPVKKLKGIMYYSYTLE